MSTNIACMDGMHDACDGFECRCPCHLGGTVITSQASPADEPPREQGTFKWPCDRRDAHHKHPIACDCGYAEVRPSMAANPNYHEWDCAYARIAPCPGVAAHPATQIGGNYKGERPESTSLFDLL